MRYDPKNRCGFWAVAIALCAIAPGCTIAPKPVQAGQVSFSGNSQNSGLLGRLPDGGYHITAAAKARYDDLISTGYGKGFTPALKPGDGLSGLPDGTWEIDDEHLIDWGVMASLKRTALKP